MCIYYIFDRFLLPLCELQLGPGEGSRARSPCTLTAHAAELKVGLYNFRQRGGQTSSLRSLAFLSRDRLLCWGGLGARGGLGGPGRLGHTLPLHGNLRSCCKELSASDCNSRGFVPAHFLPRLHSVLQERGGVTQRPHTGRCREGLAQEISHTYRSGRADGNARDRRLPPVQRIPGRNGTSCLSHPHLS